MTIPHNLKMSVMIKQAGRDFFSKNDKQLMYNLLLGGAALGGGAALTVNLAKLFSDANADRKRLKATTTDAMDDDVLYINLPDTPGVKSASQFIPYGIGIAGGAAAGVGVYALIDSIFKKQRVKDLQRELDLAQQAHVDALQDEVNPDPKPGTEARVQYTPQIPYTPQPAYATAPSAPDGTSEGLNKMADDRFAVSKGTMMAGMPIAALLLTALAGGIITNHTLSNMYKPVDKYKKDPLKPKRIVYRRNGKDIASAGTENPNDVKAAMPTSEEIANLNANIEDQGERLDEVMAKVSSVGTEFLVRLTTSHERAAKHTQLGDIVAACGTGRFKELKKAASEFGMETAMSLVKGASYTPMTAIQKEMGIQLACRSGLLQPTIEKLAAAEFLEMDPGAVACTAYPQNMDKNLRALLIKFAAAVTGQGRMDNLSEVQDMLSPEEQAKAQEMQQATANGEDSGANVDSELNDDFDETAADQIADNMYGATSNELDSSDTNREDDIEKETEDSIDNIISPEQSDLAKQEELRRQSEEEKLGI